MWRLVPIVVLLVACDGEPPAPDGGPPDAGAPIVVECAAPPEPLVAGTPATDALADAPARCGQADHAWVRDGLGEVVGLGEGATFDARTLGALAAGQGFGLPADPEHDVAIQIFTYTTQDRGALLDATALVAFPTDLAPGATPDVVLYLHGSSGFNDECAATAGLETRLLSAMIASYGYVAVAPDYLGLKNGGEPTGFLNPALVGQPTAIASLDAVRAAMRLAPGDRGDTCLPTRFLALGGSQGGHAALWVDHLAPYYARELTLVGTVASVPPADMIGELSEAVTTLGLSSGSASIFYSTGAPWYGHEARLSEVLEPPQDTAIPDRLARSCSRRFTDEFTSVDELFAAPIRDAAAAGTLADLDPWGCMAAENGVASTTTPRVEPSDPSYGILFVTAEVDEIVHTPTERAAFETLCDAGVPLRYLECAGAGHLEGTLWALPEIFEFVAARFAGERFEADACAASAPVRCRGTPE